MPPNALRRARRPRNLPPQLPYNNTEPQRTEDIQRRDIGEVRRIERREGREEGCEAILRARQEGERRHCRGRRRR